MNRNSKHLCKEQVKKRRSRKWYCKVSAVIAVIVALCTVQFLIMPVIAIENEQLVLDCPLNIHHHTEQCYDSDENLICGEADFVIHSHDENCYNEENELNCKLPNIDEHRHTENCYEEQQVLICTNEESHTHDDSCYETEKTLICEETAVLHTHDDTCYDKNGTLICGKLQITKHIHDDSCYKKLENSVSSSVKRDVMPLSNTDEGTQRSANCGYGEDGSIWWDKASSLQQVAVTGIEENTPYIIAGNSRRNVLTNTVIDGNMLEANRPGLGNASNYKSYEIWCFEKIDDKYRIYDGNGQYLKLQGQSLTLTSMDDASAFTVQQATLEEYTDCVTIESNGNYLNTFGDDSDYCSGWAGWSEADSGSCLQILDYNGEMQTANRVETVSSTNTVTNLFDYWVSQNKNDPDNVEADLNGKINQDHALKFVHGDQEGASVLNKWTGDGLNPLQGVVQNNLVDGYPVLSGNYQGEGTVSTESLEYLFNPAYESQGKQSFRNVNGLFSVDNEGYYSFDCKTQMAEFDKESHKFNVYDKPSLDGQFFPLNKAPEIMASTSQDSKLNHYFGMTITNRFLQENGGYTNEKRSTPTTFEFSGDDDVWVFIDGVLVGDVGGIHDMSSVNINFVTGEVEVGVVDGYEQPIKTTLKECYDAAGKSDITQWNDNGTYKDGTVHTLKFFFLERGNFDSNMKLKYNLTEVPQTGIKKINEYGEPVQGATLAVFAANSAYDLLYNKGGAVVDVPPDSELEYNENGDMIDSSGNILAQALYCGTTDENGELIFVDPDGKDYTINELGELFGDNFIIKEVKVPTGYRMVSSNVHLRIFQGTTQKIIMCDNTTDSGVRSATNYQVTATDAIYLRRPYNGSEAVEYCDMDGNPFGTLFAVVFKYTGEVDENGDAVGDFTSESSWTPLYGSDDDGYQLIDMSGGKSLLNASIEAAKKAQEYGNVCFNKSVSGNMKITMENLPGHISAYYDMLGEDELKNVQYLVCYYWTDQSSLKNATADNTYSVNSYPGTIDGVQYNGFGRSFGAEIQIPNLINDVFVQKLNEKGEKINGATFAMYQVKQLNDNTIQYLLEDGEYHTLSENAVISSNGEITDGEIRITPLKTDVTKSFEDGIHVGTVRFMNLTAGQYIIKEVNAPAGYSLNTSDIMVLVTKDTIYANAGTVDDGVTVGRGPGYLVSPLHEFASVGQINTTLSWVYAQMRISNESKSFADVGDASKIKDGYLMINNSNETTTDESKIFRTYLMYAKDNKGVAFNYVPNKIRNEGKDSDGYRRLFTTEGWPYYEIYQDYEYGSVEAEKLGATYDDLRGDELTNLFSRSTYIRVTDNQKTTLKVKNVNKSNEALSDAQFRLYRLNLQNENEYYAGYSENNVSWNTDVNTAMVVTTDTDGVAQAFNGLTNGEYYLEEVKPSNGYNKLNEPVKLIIDKATLTLSPRDPSDEQRAYVDEGVADENGLYTYTVTILSNKSAELPMAGGSGIFMYIAGGILLVTISVVCVCIKKRINKRQ
ncbi:MULTISPECIES: SpaA isopeptide-forming pilin-related protein [unclassified Ruminococcus]|uniref:SpaA isopeptide-forming pilin-related protein n=1 Tax=unclassified Ruminococcus TaxID=2608920 RepID=UPI00210EF7D7|nr:MULTISPECIES: SpaA isopeptide-forming pilin-related protein [unclassified Ruminococcus]MCQ4023273.1 hypothetical protein [Ruminococcus sp. zg-924]MCQ4115059.1 hypothetical protein [Ruminococcus sp. zg-921]